MPDEVFSDGFAISARPVGTHAVLVEILGELDVQTAPQAKAFLAQATITTPRHLILDLTGVRFLASAGIAVLLAAQSCGVQKVRPRSLTSGDRWSDMIPVCRCVCCT